MFIKQIIFTLPVFIFNVNIYIQAIIHFFIMTKNRERKEHKQLCCEINEINPTVIL